MLLLKREIPLSESQLLVGNTHLRGTGVITTPVVLAHYHEKDPQGEQLR